MTLGDLTLVIGSITGFITGAGALWLGYKKHTATEATERNEARLGDAEQRITEWAAINDRVEADNVRLRIDNDRLRVDNDRLRNDLHTARTDIAVLRKGWHDLPEPKDPNQ